MKNLAIITARGGSKRILKKNIKEFCGEPIINYSIKAALDSGMFDEVMVSTDDEEIAIVAKAAGAKVPFYRSEKTSNDFATTADVLIEVVEEYQKRNMQYDNMCCIYPTAPFITAEKLKKAMQMLEEEKADTVMPVVSFSFPPQRGLVINEGFIKPKFPEFISWRSQDLETMYHDCGQFYAINIKSFMSSQKVIGEKTLPIIMSELEVQDIDNLTDWELAEMKYKLMLKENNHEL